MKIHNVRLGLATNSSSSHSIVFLPNPDAVQDHDTSGGEFGSNNFTAKDEASKRDYLALTLGYHLTAQCGSDVAEAVIRSWVGKPSQGYIDHQSVLSLPLGWDGKGIDKLFWDEFQRFVLRPDVAILGGGDGDRHPLEAVTKRTGCDDLMKDSSDGCLVAKKDPSGFWTLFSRTDGTKIRLSFDENVNPKHSASPELVDVKITDFCDAGCEYCYQDSTTAGKHAGDQEMYRLSSVLGEMRVFEVAIGGGEPTKHPRFTQTLDQFRYFGIVPNFTTKSLEWMKNEKMRHQILEKCGAFAYSAQTPRDTKRLYDQCKKYDLQIEHHYTGGTKVSVQHVMGMETREEFKAFLMSCRGRVTLLGYKDVGRGKSLNRKNYDWWIDVVKEVTAKNYLQIGVDTAITSEYRKQLINAGISRHLFTTNEGSYSMYIDAVNMKAGPSSYHESALQACELNSEDQILTVYNSFMSSIVRDAISA